MRGTQLAVLLIAITISWGSADDFMQEKPSFLTPCLIHDKNNNECLTKAIRVIFEKWTEGIPGLEGLEPLDPFRVKKVRLSQKSETIQLQLEFKNLTAYGISKTSIYKSSVDPKTYTIQFNTVQPSMGIKSGYKIKGRIFLLNLDGQGMVESNTTNVDYSVTFSMKLNRRFGEDFLDVQTMKVDIKKIDGYKVNFSNLFGGNKELEDSVNELFNENWELLFELMKPSLIDTLEAITLRRYKKIFGFVPAKYFFSDLP